MKLFVEKDYQISLDDSHQEYVYIELHAPFVNYHIAHDFWAQIKEITSEINAKKILVHDRIELIREIAVSEYFSLAVFIAKSFQDVRLAYYRAEVSALMRFAETVGMNRSSGKGGIFSSIDQAKTFLLN